VRINRVTTRGGDRGETSLGNGKRVRKDDARIEAIGTVDESNAAIGVLRLATRNVPEADEMLARIQNDLFDLGADLCRPDDGDDALRVGAAQVARLEAEIATMNEKLPELKSFILPGGSPGSAYAHLARVVVRRAERALVRLGALNPAILRYMNRLSDHLFVLGRVLNDDDQHEVLWVPALFNDKPA
jgi:cob(I)alamin adenosyltransferase